MTDLPSIPEAPPTAPARLPEPPKPGTRMLMWFTVDPTSPIGGHLSPADDPPKRANEVNEVDAQIKRCSRGEHEYDSRDVCLWCRKPAPLASPPEGLPDLEKLLDEFEDAVRAHTTGSGPKARERLEKPIVAARSALIKYVRELEERTLTAEEWRFLRHSLTPRSPHDCPYCSFSPTSISDYCEEHRPVPQRVRDGLSLKLERSRRISSTGGSTREEK